MSAAVCGKPAIALSWGLMTGFKPPTQDLISGALTHSCKIVERLWQLGWGAGESAVSVYTVNVPLLPEINKPGGPDIQWTTMARTAYGRLFKSISAAPVEQTDEGGPAAIPEIKDESIMPVDAAEGEAAPPAKVAVAHRKAPLLFSFSPDISALVDPSPASMVSRHHTSCHSVLACVLTHRSSGTACRSLEPTRTRSTSERSPCARFGPRSSPQRFQLASRWRASTGSCRHAVQ